MIDNDLFCLHLFQKNLHLTVNLKIQRFFYRYSTDPNHSDTLFRLNQTDYCIIHTYPNCVLILIVLRWVFFDLNFTNSKNKINRSHKLWYWIATLTNGKSNSVLTLDKNVTETCLKRLKYDFLRVLYHFDTELKLFLHNIHSNILQLYCK